VQGCSLGCVGCCNPQTHDPESARWLGVEDFFHEIVGITDEIEGITLTGGEPLEQARAVTELLRLVRQRTSLSVILSTGFSWEEVLRIAAAPSHHSYAKPARREAQPPQDPLPLSASVGDLPANTFLSYVDVVLAGPYDFRQPLGCGLRGSSNKSVHFLTNRYSPGDLDRVPAAEVIVLPGGQVVATGVVPLALTSIASSLS
jgi:anaerobic ribonucleoside-triphosphate reductase activating protein